MEHIKSSKTSDSPFEIVFDVCDHDEQVSRCASLLWALILEFPTGVFAALSVLLALSLPFYFTPSTDLYVGGSIQACPGAGMLV